MCMLERNAGNSKEFKLVEFLLLADCHEDEVGREIEISPFGNVEFCDLEIQEVSGSFKSTWEFIKGEVIKINGMIAKVIYVEELGRILELIEVGEEEILEWRKKDLSIWNKMQLEVSKWLNKIFFENMNEPIKSKIKNFMDYLGQFRV